MSKFGVNFNYKRDYRRTWLYFTIVVLMILILLFFLVFDVFVSRAELLSTLDGFCFNFLYFVVWIPDVISFIIFIRSLYERFVTLNTLLRFFHYIHGNRYWVLRRFLSAFFRLLQKWIFAQK